MNKINNNRITYICIARINTILELLKLFEISTLKYRNNVITEQIDSETTMHLFSHNILSNL